MRKRVTEPLTEICCLFVIAVIVSGLSCRKNGDRRDDNAEPRIIKTKTGIEMVVIPAGWFEMGGEDGSPDERPVHRVWVGPFWMDRYEVTQPEFRKYQLPDPSHFKNPKHPLDQINWTDAALYCNERSRAEGLEPAYDEDTWRCNFNANGYRLPTEAEWEYACRAGTDTKYNFGNDSKKLRSYAWFAENSAGKTHPVGQKRPNLWGLYDMHGNVAEWCNEFYADDYSQRTLATDPKGPAAGKERVLRGGAWNSTAEACRSTCRASDPSINDTCLASDAIGFRCARNAPSPRSASSPRTASAALRPAYHIPAANLSKTGFVYHDIYLAHRTSPGHPESPQRLVAILERLKAEGLYDRLYHVVPSPASRRWLTTVHTPEYVDRVEGSCQGRMGYFDSIDVSISPKSYEAALMAAGGVMAAVDAVMDNRIENAFCAVRPPGHHAVKDAAMGFCIFNNVAVAARYIQKKYNLPKVLIVDWDVHHGNATQAMFYDDPNVLYFGVHQYPFYPGTGAESEKGAGPGLNYNINVPLPAGAGDEVYLKVFEEKLRPAALDFHPDFILISAGFDAYKDDPIGSMKVTVEGFARLTRIVKDIAQQCCRGRLVSVLEGGYDLQGLAASVEAHIRVLMEGTPAATDSGWQPQ
jgi:acetoin utilization deacetylase AcuC-like enzyme/formylglycine-generating enzyme required for sulfatase activity